MRKKQEKTTIDPNRIPTRDPLLKRLIEGATKAGIHKDRRKEADKKKCRKPVQDENE